jgi:hypothetical protein
MLAWAESGRCERPLRSLQRSVQMPLFVVYADARRLGSSTLGGSPRANARGVRRRSPRLE